MMDHTPRSPSVQHGGGGRDASGSSLPRPSYETGASSATGGSSRAATPLSRRTPNHDDSLDSSPASNASASQSRDGRTSKRLRHRSGGFLLHDRVKEQQEPGPSRIPRRIGSHKMTESPRNHHSEPLNDRRHSKTPSDNAQGNYGSLRSRGDDAAANGHRRSAVVQGSPRADIDSAQIVNMALSLSESRRISSSRRNVSITAPPHLPVQPDPSSLGSQPKQYFPPQRKISMAGNSPKPSPGFSPWMPSLGIAHSPLPGAFESPHDGGLYRYQFSASTLARAEKAKEHMELKAEYRRLLELLPPLNSLSDRAVSASRPSSPTGHLQPAWKFGQLPSGVPLGRQYNPLQYIRNRKVRARERKVIDGEQQGFGDVDCVRAWVDSTVARVNSSSSFSSLTFDNEHNSAMPPYPAADSAAQAGQSLSRTSTRARRPRVDWLMEPCDMIADAYWIEQDGNKHLIENREWHKICPPTQTKSHRPMSSRPMSQQAMGADSVIAPFPPKLLQGDEDSADALASPSNNTASSPVKARDRTRQKKMQEMKAFHHHRHSNSILGNHDFLSLGRDSDLSSSESENDGRGEIKRLSRRGRAGTISSNSNDLFHKQMQEMMAREAHEKELETLPETVHEHEPLSNDTTPDRVTASRPSSLFHSRKASVADFSDSDHRPVSSDRRASTSGYRPGRPSLEVPVMAPWKASQAEDFYPSAPASPELDAQDEYRLPAIGGDISSPRSRSPSPSRNPMSMVKRKWRERDRDSKYKREASRDRSHQTPASPQQRGAEKKVRKQQSAGDSPSEFSPGHRSTQSLQLADDQVGLRGIFKPRIDGFRGGVLRIGDKIWKKTAYDDFSDPDAESEGESRRGRSRATFPLSRPRSNTEVPPGSKHFLDTMPEFRHSPDANSRSSAAAAAAADPRSQPNAMPSSRPGSSQSSRFELLKLPRIDVRGPSPSGSTAKRDHSEQSDTPSRGQLAEKGKEVITKDSVSSLTMNRSRKWSFANRHSSIGRDAKLTRQDIARVRALVVSSGIKAMEINRRAQERYAPLGPKSSPINPDARKLEGLPWSDIARFDPAEQDFSTMQAPVCELYLRASSNLYSAIQVSSQRWQQSADRFTNRTVIDLQKRILNVRNRIKQDLSGSAQMAADEADETARELNLGQPLKLKKVLDLIDAMAQNKRRRFRWLRRGIWLAVEWMLVGFMWYVWFVVMIFRIFWGTGKVVVGSIRWLLWL